MCLSCKLFGAKETHWAANWLWVCVHRRKKRTGNTLFFVFQIKAELQTSRKTTQRNTSRFSNNNINNGDWQPPYRCLSAPTVVEIVNTERSLYGLNVIWKNPGTVTPLAVLFFHSNILHFSCFIFVSHLVQEAFNLLFHISVPQTSVKDSQRLNSSRTPK